METSEEEAEAQLVLLNERGHLIYSTAEVKTQPLRRQQDDEPDDFFELSVNEVKQRMRELRQQVHTWIYSCRLSVSVF